MPYFFYFLSATLLSALFTPVVKRTAFRFQILDIPNSPRKIQKHPTPLLGGVAVFLSFVLVTAGYLLLSRPDFNIVPFKFFLGIFGGGLVLLVGGILDDKYNLPPRALWLFPALASLCVVASGIGVGITTLSNPFGGTLNIGQVIFGVRLSALIMWLWMMGMIFTTKFLDGLDGLCSGIALIGGLTLFALSLTEHINQPITASLAVIFTGAIAGFLLYNFHPASIFLGESGSTFLGFGLGVLAIILGGKIATALLIMGIPILDVAWAIMRRLWYGQSPFKADKSHLHHRLLDIGLSQRQAVLVLYGISAIFGFTAVFLQSMGKLIALGVLFCVMVVLALALVMIYKRQHPHIPDLFDKVDEKAQK
ncbi:MAG: undecaprenyl/decaprenyl-phosphate alpha-N-acetylglucosaminyl 1-phosphate transferase [Patescibacteria group bacterium]|nr:undecaprenyl/decaprenyl-phosphate alpha-N-acetylglucosaminyl 1-phosphate transferase [Patescibacteria group bacterium]